MGGDNLQNWFSYSLTSLCFHGEPDHPPGNGCLTGAGAGQKRPGGGSSNQMPSQSARLRRLKITQSAPVGGAHYVRKGQVFYKKPDPYGLRDTLKINFHP